MRAPVLDTCVTPIKATNTIGLEAPLSRRNTLNNQKIMFHAWGLLGRNIKK